MDSPLDLWVKITERAEGETRFTFYDGRVPDTPADAYVIGYPNPGYAYATRLAGGSQRLQFDPYFVCVGRSTSQCINTVRLFRDLFTDWRPDPSLPAGSLVERDDGQRELIKDEGSNPADVRYSFTLHYRLHTSRS